MTKLRSISLLMSTALLLGACADAQVPGARDVTIPPARNAEERKDAINERPDAVMYLPLGRDVLVPEAKEESPLPAQIVGPFELRGETLAGALQLILDGVDIPVAFESEDGLTRTITVTNLKGELGSVIDQVCSLADLYCSFERGVLVVKNEQVFTVSLPPIGGENQEAFLTTVNGAISEITGRDVVSENATSTLIYRATQRTAETAQRYFQRLRRSTALIIFETYVWEVALNAGNSTGVQWDEIAGIGKWNIGFNITGATDPGLGVPVSIGLPTQGDVDLTAGDVFDFISDYGAVKTISQPQITVLSGSAARLRVADRQNYVASVTRSVSEGEVSVSTTTDSVDSGFTLEIQSGWDNATVYGSINILLQEVRDIETFDDNPDAVVQLPQTTERELVTQVRIRPGDSLLIAGLVREVDSFDENGPGINTPIIPSSRTATTSNIELVFLLKPRVIAFTSDGSVAGHTMSRATSVNGPDLSGGVAAPVHLPVPFQSSNPPPEPISAPVAAPVPPPIASTVVVPEPVQETVPETAPVTAMVPAPLDGGGMTGGMTGFDETASTATVPPVVSEVAHPAYPPADQAQGNPVEISPLPPATDSGRPGAAIAAQPSARRTVSGSDESSVTIDYDALNTSR